MVKGRKDDSLLHSGAKNHLYRLLLYPGIFTDIGLKLQIQPQPGCFAPFQHFLQRGIRLGPATPRNRPEASSFRSCAKDSSPTQPLPSVVRSTCSSWITNRHAVSAQMHVQLNPVAACFPRLLKGEHGVLRISGAKSPVGKIFGHLRPLLSDFHHIIKPRRCKGTGSGHPLASKREAGYNKYRFPLIRMDSPKNRKVVFSC